MIRCHADNRQRPEGGLAMRYFKMNGCGNDFVILDARGAGALTLTPDQARAIADRETGAGCDQVIAIEDSIRGDAFMRIWNADGGEVAACGNASRCVAWLLFEEGGARPVKIETAAGLLRAERAGGAMVTVDLGSPLLKWEEIPLSRPMDTVQLDYAIDVGLARLEGPGACNMGNPHAVFFVDTLKGLPAKLIGKRVQKADLFPESVNVGFAEVQDRNRIRLKVYERGAGLTLACGTGACAAVVAAHRRGLTERRVTVELDGGVLEIDWNGKDDRVRMTGPVALERQGDLPVPTQANTSPSSAEAAS
jgi:diaminopimelate epimerase